MNTILWTDLKSGCQHIAQSASNHLKNLSQRIVALCLKIQEIFFRLFGSNKNQSASTITAVNRSAIQPSGPENSPPSTSTQSPAPSPSSIPTFVSNPKLKEKN